MLTLPNKIEAGLREFAPDAEIHFVRLAVLPWQIEEWRLPGRPTKSSDTRSRGFSNTSVELDAVDSHRLRQMVERAIERHLPADQLKVLKAAEESERGLIRAIATKMEVVEEDYLHALAWHDLTKGGAS